MSDQMTPERLREIACYFRTIHGAPGDVAVEDIDQAAAAWREDLKLLADARGGTTEQASHLRTALATERAMSSQLRSKLAEARRERDEARKKAEARFYRAGRAIELAREFKALYEVACVRIAELEAERGE